MKSDDLVTALVGYLKTKMTSLSSSVYKNEKPVSVKRATYIVVNCLPIRTGEFLNTSTILNVNVHCARLNSGDCDTATMVALVDSVLELIPSDDGTEECDTLSIGGDRFEVDSVYNPAEDTDGTYYTNIRVRATFTNYKTL